MTSTTAITNMDQVLLTLGKDRPGLVVDPKWWDVENALLHNSLPQALDKMIVRRLTSIPVVNAHYQYVGYLSLSEVYLHLVGLLKKCSSFDSEESRNAVKLFRNTKVAELLVQSTPPDCSIRGTDYSMFHVLEVMVNRSWRSLAVINNFKGVNCVVTQSALIKYLLKALDGSKLLKTSAGKFRPFASVVKVLGSTSVFDAVRLMNREGVRAVAIVDEKDVLQDNFSLHDLTALGDNGQRANMLSLSVQAFKDWVKTHDVWSPMSSVVVKGTTTLGKVMREMVDNDIHRVYVVNSKAERVVLDVIAMTDVLRFILRQCTYPLV